MIYYIFIIVAFTISGVIAITVTNNDNLQDSLEIEKELVKLQKKVESMQQTNDAHKLIIQDLVETLNALRNSSKQEQSHVNGSLQSIMSQIHYTSLSLLDMQKMITSLQQGHKDAGKGIAFTASSSSVTTHHNKKIIYDKVITNGGNAYDNTTGIFTCPAPGIYVFTWSTMSSGSSYPCYAYIYHNGNEMMMSYSYETNGGFHEVASNTMLLSLTTGDHVWIGTSPSSIYCYGYPYTGFSGWKL